MKNGAISMLARLPRPLRLCVWGLFATMAPLPAQASHTPPPEAPQTAEAGLAYADLADLVDASDLVIKAQIRKQATVSAERAPGLQAGWARLYIEARPTALLAGEVPMGEDIGYLVDMPLTAKGRAPRLKGNTVILFGRGVPGAPGSLQLAGRHAQRAASPDMEQRLRPILAEFSAADAPPRIKAIREVLWVPGNLAGESETQMFLSTLSDGPALISVLRRPGLEPSWGVSWSELVTQPSGAPPRDTLEWYRLACFLPPRLPAAAQISQDPEARWRAEEDYRLVLAQLGECRRTLSE